MQSRVETGAARIHLGAELFWGMAIAAAAVIWVLVIGLAMYATRARPVQDNAAGDAVEVHQRPHAPDDDQNSGGEDEGADRRDRPTINR